MLVVEDEEHVRDMVKTMLIHLGFTVHEARDGIAAVEVFRQHLDEICCVICDLTMPRILCFGLAWLKSRTGGDYEGFKAKVSG